MDDKFDSKSLCEEFARLKGFKISLRRSPPAVAPLYFVRIRYGKYCLKYVDGMYGDTPEAAYANMVTMLCSPDDWFNAGNFKGWSHFGKCSCPEELAVRMAVYGGAKT